MHYVIVFLQRCSNCSKDAWSLENLQICKGAVWLYRIILFVAVAGFCFLSQGLAM